MRKLETACVGRAQEPILALRRQLAELAGARDEAGRCWLQAARACRLAGHGEVQPPSMSKFSSHH
jgi:hypothetical protein